MITEVTKLLGIQYPVIQGGMAWVAEHHLAAAVSEAGGPARRCPRYTGPRRPWPHRSIGGTGRVGSE